MFSYKMTTALLLIFVGPKNYRCFFVNNRQARNGFDYGVLQNVRNNIETNIESVIFEPLLVGPETLELQDEKTHRLNFGVHALTDRQVRQRYHQTSAAHKLGYLMHPQRRKILKLRPCRSFSWRFYSC